MGGFPESIKLAPGIRWNLSASGSSWTFGPRGASVGVGKRGTFLNTGIPGTGLSSRERLSAPSYSEGSASASTSAPATDVTKVSMTCGIREDGTPYFVDSAGAPMSERWIELAKKQNKDAILGLIQRKCDEINEQVEALGRLHHDTSDARVKPAFRPPPFREQEPVMPKPRSLGFLDKLFKSRRVRVEAANQEARECYEEALSTWRQEKAMFDRQIAKRKVLVEQLIYEDIHAMEAFLEENLQDIAWPRETIVSLEVQDSGSRVMLDVDLPELEDMPSKLAAVPSRGLKLSVKELSATKVQRLYAEHVHGILFRLVGEAFAALPTVRTVVASGYSQRRDPATAHLRDDYLLSVHVTRSEWEATDFSHLTAIDVISSLARHDLRRDMLKSGLLKTITPHPRNET